VNPEVFFKTCVAMKFVDDDDDESYTVNMVAQVEIDADLTDIANTTVTGSRS